MEKSRSSGAEKKTPQRSSQFSKFWPTSDELISGFGVYHSGGSSRGSKVTVSRWLHSPFSVNRLHPCRVIMLPTESGEPGRDAHCDHSWIWLVSAAPLRRSGRSSLGGR